MWMSRWSYAVAFVALGACSTTDFTRPVDADGGVEGGAVDGGLTEAGNADGGTGDGCVRTLFCDCRQAIACEDFELTSPRVPWTLTVNNGAALGPSDAGRASSGAMRITSPVLPPDGGNARAQLAGRFTANLAQFRLSFAWRAPDRGFPAQSNGPTSRAMMVRIQEASQQLQLSYASTGQITMNLNGKLVGVTAPDDESAWSQLVLEVTATGATLSRDGNVILTDDQAVTPTTGLDLQIGLPVNESPWEGFEAYVDDILIENR
jgi:hypothetical protein